MANKKPNSLMGWLGRQVGFVKKAVVNPAPKVVYRKETVQQAKVEGKPDQVLRRIVIDEVIVEPKQIGGDNKNTG